MATTASEIELAMLKGSSTRLHIAASNGDADMVREVLTINPELAFELDENGNSALHLAAAHGHLQVVKELLLTTVTEHNKPHLCMIWNQDGFLPIHTAAIRGKSRVLREIMHACPNSIQIRAMQTISVLHLAVRSNSLETVTTVLEKMDKVEEVLNDKDEKGNTVLHLATARRLVEIVQLLVNQPKIAVNELNGAGKTALDLLSTSPEQKEDFLIRKAIHDVETQRANGSSPSLPPPRENNGFSFKDDQQQARDSQDDQKRYQKIGTLMIVATLIATISFQAGLSPPGGVYSFSDAKAATPSDNINVGQSIILHDSLFIAFDVVAMFASVSTILLLICCAPRMTNLVLEILTWFIWIAVVSTAIAFITAARKLFDFSYAVQSLFLAWLIVLVFFMAWIFVKFNKFVYGKVNKYISQKWGNTAQNNGTRRTRAIAFLKYMVYAAILAVELFAVLLFSLLLRLL